MKQTQLFLGIYALAFVLQVQPMRSKIDFTAFTLEELRTVDTRILSCESMDDYNLILEQLLSKQNVEFFPASTMIPSLTTPPITPDLSAPIPSVRRTHSDSSLVGINVAAEFIAQRNERLEILSAPATAGCSPSAGNLGVDSHSSSQTTSSASSRPSSPTKHVFFDSDIQPAGKPLTEIPIQPQPIEPMQRPGYPPAYPEGSEIRSRQVNTNGTNPSPRGSQIPEAQWRSEEDLASTLGAPEPEHGIKLPSLLQTAGVALFIWTTVETRLAYKNITQEEWNNHSSVAQKARLLARATASAMCSRPRQAINEFRKMFKNDDEK